MNERSIGRDIRRTPFDLLANVDGGWQDRPQHRHHLVHERRDLDDAAAGLVQQNAAGDSGGLTGLEGIQQISEGEPRIDNVLRHQYVLALYCVTEVHTRADIDRLAEALREVLA